jgi:aspartate 1-decarboxylase
MSFGLYDAEEVAIHQAKVLVLDEKNRVAEHR